MSEYTLPDDNRLERLICEAFEFAPGPDMPRLHAIGERIARRAITVPPARPRPGIPWWAVLLFGCGAAAAAWWAGEALLFRSAPPVQTAPPAAAGDPRGSERPDAGPVRAGPDAAGSDPDGGSAVIDRREAG